jgi:cellulose biosynthesis protein BcsQ
MKTIAVVNSKGGVAKTTTAMALVDYAVAKHGAKAILIDLDQQAAASKFLLRNYKAGHSRVVRANKTAAHYFLESYRSNCPVDLGGYLTRNVGVLRSERNGRNGDLGLISASIDGEDAAREITDELRSSLEESTGEPFPREFTSEYQRFACRFADNLRNDLHDLGVGHGYELAIIDTPAGRSFFTDIAMWAADILLVPITPEPIPVSESGSFIETLKKEKLSGRRLPTPHVVFTAQRDTSKEVSNAIRAGMLEPKIARKCEFLDAAFSVRTGMLVDPIPSYETLDEKYKNAASAVNSFGREVLRLVGDGMPNG